MFFGGGCVCLFLLFIYIICIITMFVVLGLFTCACVFLGVVLLLLFLLFVVVVCCWFVVVVCVVVDVLLVVGLIF